ncbi:Fe2+-dependent dioxygenase [Henriciella mobilis]|uniref:Fe2+-dependent dioxygenase n=1 Tax=Henriciella mobilis TaxID=2305467 RepID=UPI001F43F236|nr:Fe2+-dependent dioxygenase [Henriciella mobilis]
MQFILKLNGGSMYFSVPGLLTAEDVARVGEKAGQLDWADGRSTAGRTAKTVKSNLQADMNNELGLGVHDFLMRAISGSSLVKRLARPKRFSRLILSRTENGGHYGFHVDNAIMGRDGHQLRTDLSFTLFLSDPGSYSGGELNLAMSSGDIDVKPEAGTLILYPSGAIHQVRPVTSGSRLACIGWIESRIQRADQRELLFDLETVRSSLKAAHADQRLLLDKSISNLTRMWAD